MRAGCQLHPRMPMNSTARFLLGLPLLAAMLLAGCQKPPAITEEVRPVRTITVGVTPTRTNSLYAGDVRARYESTLGFRVGGKIASRNVDVGSTVKAGQLLFSLDGRDLQLQQAASKAQLASAQAEFSLARNDLERYRDLSKKGYVSKSELDRADLRYKSAMAGVESVTAQSEQSSNQSGYASLRADADGVVTAVLAEAGQVVAPGTPVVRIARTGAIEVAAAVPEDQIGNVHAGMPVTVTLWAQGKTEYPGSVREISAAADPGTRTYAARISVPDAPAEMRIGMTATVKVPIAAPQLIHVPTQALVTSGKSAGVWVVEPASSAVRFASVDIAGLDGSEVLIAKGLKPGDVVVTAGAGFLTEGRKVRLMAAVSLAAQQPGGG